MSRRFSREEILERLRKTIAMGKPILVACCGAGILAKCAEVGGADIIMTACTSKSRLMGLPTTPLGNPNQDMLSLFEEIDNVVRDTPIIASVDSLDPTHWDLKKLLDRYTGVGYCGVLNYPTMGLYGERRRALRESVGLGFSREVEMVRIAHEMNIFTVSYVFNVEDAKQMVEAGVDCIAAHVGATSGGMLGFKGASLEEGARLVQDIIDISRAMRPDIIHLAHGGSFATPEDTEYMYQHTDAVGFVGASSIERIPIEKAVTDVVKRFKSVPMKKH